jgi:thermitase
MSPESDARMQRWQSNRAARLAALPWLHTDTSAGHPVRYLAGELLVASEHEDLARTVLTGMGVASADITAQQAPLGFVQLTAPGADIPAASSAIRAQAGPAAAGPHHVFVSTPFEMGGPYGPPVSASGYQLPAGPDSAAQLQVTVVDTGIWRDSPLPADWYEADANDYDDTLDADSDVGHANFIVGVIMSQTTNARVRIVKVLDANGMCSEISLVAALTALEDTDVVNLSLGGFSHEDHPPVLLHRALDHLLTGHDRVVVAAAGNEGNSQRPYWPAAFSGTAEPFAQQVLAVAAHDGTEVCSWSNTGPWVDLTAPGSDITSTYVTHTDFPTGFAQWSGTSFAAPYVAAHVAARHQAGGTVADAAELVLKEAAGQAFNGYPGLV